MVPGMENTPNWMLWLLVGLAIIPMLIPAQRRYQVLRLRLTAARLRGFNKTVPARLLLKNKRSPYLPIPVQ
jgi:beta-lactamase regulating signal transducer with metallopeptidase domain